MTKNPSGSTHTLPCGDSSVIHIVQKCVDLDSPSDSGYYVSDADGYCVIISTDLLVEIIAHGLIEHTNLG
jgi:hypothetical protein